jgi:hypothetical protein
MAIGIYFPSQRLYHVDYEWGRLIRVVLAACAVVAAVLLLGLQPATALGIAVKLGATAVFVLLVFVLKVFDGADIRETREALSKMFTRS